MVRFRARSSPAGCPRRALGFAPTGSIRRMWCAGLFLLFPGTTKVTDGRATAAIQRKPEGQVMETVRDHKIPAGRGRSSRWTRPRCATLAQRDALTLLAVMIQHTDSKPEQQRLLCLPGGVNAEGWCDKPFLAVHDAGLTLAHGNLWNEQGRCTCRGRATRGSVTTRRSSRCPALLVPEVAVPERETDVVHHEKWLLAHPVGVDAAGQAQRAPAAPPCCRCAGSSPPAA